MQALPPPVVIQKGQEAKAFAAFPKVADGEKHFVVLGINVTGEVKAVEAARSKLSAAGWPAEYLADQTGKKVLSVGAEKRTLQAVVELLQRFQSREFGEATPLLFTIPDPSFAN